MSRVIDRDRGLGTAYERFVFYELLDRWASQLGAESVLEGPLDGMAGVPGVWGVGLARRGLDVHSVVTSERQAEIVRAIYARSAPGRSWRVSVGHEAHVSELPKADLVVCYHAFELTADWRAYLDQVATRAKKGLIVAVCNADTWGVRSLRAAARLRGASGFEAPEAWRTSVLGPRLWELGRVVDHRYFDCPWWPDLQVAPGQSLADRLRQLVRQDRGALQFTADLEGAGLSGSYVYGPDRWPYFGDDGFDAELGPAMRRHPSFDRASQRVAKHFAHLHAFVVDVRPRTRQEKRRLARLSE